MRTRPNQGANCECCARRAAERAAARAVVPAAVVELPAPPPALPSPSPESSTPPAPEPIRSGEGDLLSALAAASETNEAELDAIRAEFTPIPIVVVDEIFAFPAEVTPPPVPESEPVIEPEPAAEPSPPAPVQRRNKRRR